MKDIYVFVSGVITGLIANFLYDKIKIRQRGNEPFLFTRTIGKRISIEGEIPNTITGQDALSELNRIILPKKSEKK